MKWNRFKCMNDGDLTAEQIVYCAMRRISKNPASELDLRAFVERRVSYIAWRPNLSKMDLDGQSYERPLGNMWTRRNLTVYYSFPGEPPPGASRTERITDHTTLVVGLRTVLAKGAASGRGAILGYVVDEVAIGDVFCGLDRVHFDIYNLISSDFKVPQLTG